MHHRGLRMRHGLLGFALVASFALGLACSSGPRTEPRHAQQERALARTEEPAVAPSPAPVEALPTPPAPVVDGDPTAPAAPTAPVEEGTPVRPRDESRLWTLRQSPRAASVTIPAGTAPHYRWPTADPELELRAYGEGPWDVRVAIRGQEHPAFVAADGPGVYRAEGGVVRVGDLVVAWIFRAEGGQLDAAVLRATDGAVVGEPVQVSAVPRQPRHECAMTVCEARVLPVLDGERLAVLVLYQGATLFDAGATRGRRVQLPIPLVPSIEHRPEFAPWTLQRDGRRTTLVAPSAQRTAR